MASNGALTFFWVASREGSGILLVIMGLSIQVLPSGYLQTNAYLLSDPDRGEAVLVDAPHFVWEAVQPLIAAQGCALVALLLTHGHYDHTGDAAKIQTAGVPLYGHLADRRLFEDPECMRGYAYPPDLEMAGFEIDHWVADGDRMDLLGQTCEVRHVPGHCPGNVLYYFEAAASAFVGDSLFAGSIGRTDLPDGDFGALEGSIRRRIYSLPGSTTVLPGHGPSTTVEAERETNPFVPGE